MPITKRTNGSYMVTVQRASALPGYRRIRKTAHSHYAASILEETIEKAVEVYGKWPVEEGDKPLRIAASKNLFASTAARRDRTSGTLREAAQLALDTHWSGKRWADQVKYIVWSLVDFFEARHVVDLDEITSADIDAMVAHQRAKQNAPGTINKALGALHIINRVALKRIPPLATIELPIQKVAGRRIEKWWLRPEDHKRVVQELRDPISGRLITDPLFADLIDVICYQGLRVEEALRLEARLLMGLDTDEPWLQPPGTKTSDAQNSIPIYPEAVTPLQLAKERAERHRWSLLFPLRPRQAAERWNDVRDFLGVRDIPTSTMKSLRRTFAWYANSKGMPTSTLQKVLRHKGIGTTAGYLDLVGDGSLRDSRRYFEADSTKVQTDETPRSNVGEIIKAYASTGATPEEVARFAKELMI